MKATFWGVRGSIPSPLSPEQVRAKVREGIRLAAAGEPVPFEVESTYGGNTTCVEIQAGSELFICDMGTGVRELGKRQAGQLFSAKKAKPDERPVLRGTILQSHVHWDHIQGLPFWSPLFLPRRSFDCKFSFFGGKRWDAQLDAVYRGQMSPPEFPVTLEELEQSAMALEFSTVFDGWSQQFWSNEDRVGVLARKLFHPQETFGYRVQSHDGTSIAFTTDHEPYAGGLPQGLLELVNRADIWITDCQYSHDEYLGARGPQKMGWGHSYPEYIAAVAREACPKRIVTTHHDPDSDDARVLAIARQVQELSGIETVPAFEGLAVEAGVPL
jgi:phosphoribosyl 1,2-cyclic phosphodiesterase